MSLKQITAVVFCDKCGDPFSVFLDAAAGLPEGRSLFDLVEDAVHGGTATNDPIGEPTSVQDGMMLCSDCCTAIADRDQS